MYGWTFEHIANMSPASQMAALGMLDELSNDGKTMSFNTEREYQEWLIKNNG